MESLKILWELNTPTQVKAKKQHTFEDGTEDTTAALMVGKQKWLVAHTEATSNNKLQPPQPREDAPPPRGSAFNSLDSTTELINQSDSGRVCFFTGTIPEERISHTWSTK